MICILLFVAVFLFFFSLTIYTNVRTEIVESKRFDPEREKIILRHLFSALVDITAGCFWYFFTLAVILYSHPKTLSGVISSLVNFGLFGVVFIVLFLLSTYLGIKNLYYYNYKIKSKTINGADEDLTHADSIETDGWDESADDNPRIAAIRETVLVATMLIAFYVLLFLFLFYHNIFPVLTLRSGLFL